MFAYLCVSQYIAYCDGRHDFGLKSTLSGPSPPLKPGVFFTDYRRPLDTFLSSFRAATGLYFFKETFA
jgi:hypothetical protein